MKDAGGEEILDGIRIGKDGRHVGMELKECSIQFSEKRSMLSYLMASAKRTIQETEFSKCWVLEGVKTGPLFSITPPSHPPRHFTLSRGSSSSQHLFLVLVPAT